MTTYCGGGQLQQQARQRRASPLCSSKRLKKQSDRLETTKGKELNYACRGLASMMRAGVDVEVVVVWPKSPLLRSAE